MPFRPLERLAGLALTSLGAWLTAHAWHDAAFFGRFSLLQATLGPTLAIVGLGVTFFRTEHSTISDLIHLRTRWILLVLFALVLGAINVGHLRGW